MGRMRREATNALSGQALGQGPAGFVAGGEEVTVVFEHPPSPPIRSTVIEVAYAPRPRRDSADDEIVRRLADDSEPGAVRVVTSDLWLADRVRAAGATVEPAAPFRALIEDA